ncbi:MAG: protein tyrosine phosphatase family protein [Pseudomonadota bacterium]
MNRIVSRLALTAGLILVSVRGFADLGEIHNYHEVDDSLSTGGHVMAPQVPELKEAGFELVVNLATVQEDHNASDGPRIAAEGIAYMHIPVPWSSPTLEDLDLFFAVMDARADRKTLVHCMANYRASAFVYLYRTLRMGVSEAEARPDLEVVWDADAWREYPQWADLMKAAKARAN